MRICPRFSPDSTAGSLSGVALQQAASETDSRPCCLQGFSEQEIMNDASYDAVVVGAGSAALCAAISAREPGAKVLTLERAPREMRGGYLC